MNSKKLIELQIIAMAIYDANNTCMTIDECADFLGVHKNTVKNRIHSKERKIKAKLIGTAWRIPKIQFLDKIIDSLQLKLIDS